MGYIDLAKHLYQCECGNTFELDPSATRCPCPCHDPMLQKAKNLGLYCETCGFSCLNEMTFKEHFYWTTHLKAVKEKGL
jgi:hypothetical protein